MNPFDGVYHKEVTIRTRKRKRSHSKVFDYVMKCLRERKHSHMLRYKAGTNKTHFEVDFYDMKVHNQWNLKCISLFMAVDKIVKEKREKEVNYCQNTKNRFKSNMRKLENKYIKFLYEEKKSTALRTKSYMILNPPAVHQVQQQNIVPPVFPFQSVERQEFQVLGGSMIVVPPGRELDYQGSQSVDEGEIVNVEEIDSVVEEAHSSFTRLPDEGEIVNSDKLNVEKTGRNVEDNSSCRWLPGLGLKYKDVIKDDKLTPAAKKARLENGSDCSRSSDWRGLDKQNRKENIMVSSVSETTLVSVEMTDSLKGMNFPVLKVMDGYQLSDVMNSEMKKGYVTLDIMNSEMKKGYVTLDIMNSEMINNNDTPGIMNSEMINGNHILDFMNSDMRNGNDTLDFINSDTINGYGKLGIMNSEKNRYEDKENYIEVSDYPCLLGNYEDKVPLNSYQNDLTLDFDENNVLYGDPFNGEKPNIEVSSDEMDFDFDGEVGIETISDIDLCEFFKDLTEFN